MFDELKIVSALLGNNSLLVQGAGGNTSLKVDDVMYIKASGTWLINANETEIFTSVAYNKIRHNLNSGLDDPLEGCILGKSPLRPSIETTLHALMEHQVVLHVHPVELISLLILPNAKLLLKDLLSDINWTWVDYFRPGPDLAGEVRDILKLNQFDVLILGNHGIVVGGDTCNEAISLLNKVIDLCKNSKRNFCPPLEDSLSGYSKVLNMYPVANPLTHALGLDSVANQFCKLGSTVLYPDQAVFLGASMNCVEVEDCRVVATDCSIPDYVIISGVGVFISKQVAPGLEEMLACHAEILIRTPAGVDLNYLSRKQVDELLDWEPEKYRQAIGK